MIKLLLGGPGRVTSSHVGEVHSKQGLKKEITK